MRAATARAARRASRRATLAGAILVAGLGIAAVTAAAPVSAGGPRLEGRGLATALRAGGYVLYFRHAATNWSMTDSEPPDLRRCDKQRNLSARGRAQARAIARWVRMLELPIGEVLSSEYCRARDTARLAFGRLRVSRDLTGLGSAASEGERARRILALRRLLGTRPPTGTNTVLVAHLFTIQGASDVSIEEG